MDSAWEQYKLQASLSWRTVQGKMLEKAAESPAVRCIIPVHFRDALLGGVFALLSRVQGNMNSLLGRLELFFQHFKRIIRQYTDASYPTRYDYNMPVLFQLEVFIFWERNIFIKPNGVMCPCLHARFDQCQMLCNQIWLRKETRFHNDAYMSTVFLIRYYSYEAIFGSAYLNAHVVNIIDEILSICT